MNAMPPPIINPPFLFDPIDPHADAYARERWETIYRPLIAERLLKDARFLFEATGEVEEGIVHAIFLALDGDECAAGNVLARIIREQAYREAGKLAARRTESMFWKPTDTEASAL